MVGKTKAKINQELQPVSASQNILLEEYRFLYTQYLSRRNETLTRTNFFITAASVSLGGVLVFGSGNGSVSFASFKIVLLAVLVILFAIGIEIYTYIIHRDIASDRDVRGLARVRRYFVELDPKLEDYFVNVINDVPTGYVVKNTSGMRHIMQMIESFLFGLALMILSTFTTYLPEINVAIGIGVTILTYLILEAIARRRFRVALRIAEKEIKFKNKIGSKQSVFDDGEM